MKPNCKLITRYFYLSSLCTFALLIGCSSQASKNSALTSSERTAVNNADQFLVVDCLLPGRVRTMGQLGTMITARRPIKTAAGDCGARGGEYVAYDRANYQTSLKVWLDKAKNGDAEAQTYVGEIYEKRSDNPDYAAAAQWYRKAAEQGFSRAQISLGRLYERGLGVAQDSVTSMNWYRKASGLTDDNLAFASTIETEVRSEYDSEIKLLKSELARSRQDTDQLRQQLNRSKKQLKQGRQQLNQTRSDFNRYQKSLKTLKSRPTAPGQQQAIRQLEQKLKARETQLLQQKTKVQQLQQQSTQQNTELSSKLKKAQQHAKLLTTELGQKKQASEQLQAQVIQTQLKFSETEAKLAKLQQRYQSEQAKNSEADRQSQASFSEQSNSQDEQVRNLSKQLKQRETELAQQRTQLSQLEQKKQRLSEEKKLLQQTSASSAIENPQLKQLASQVAQHEQQANQQRQRISQLETEMQTLAQNKSERIQAHSQTLSAKNTDLQVLQTQINANETKLASYQQTIEALKQKQQNTVQVVYAPPSIEIIEPPFTLTRGIRSVSVRANVPQREITGKVTATAGLGTFKINNRTMPVNDRGLFTAMIPLKSKRTPVKLIAKDKQGQTATLEFLLMAAKAIKKPVSLANKPKSNVNFGKYHALVIGNSRYQYLPILKTPNKDAREVADILKRKYGFNTRLLMDADRYAILSALNNLRKTLSKDDNLLIYYAGHGELDQVNMRGHWLPVDAESDSTANWISTVAITDILNAMAIRKVMIVSDSCYSGAMSLSSLARLEPGISADQKQKWLEEMASGRSRTVLTSGGLEPVLDAGAGEHSVFAQSFIEALETNNTVMDGQSLYRKVTAGFQRAASRIELEQTPQYGPIEYAGHSKGDFFLVPRV